MDLRQKQEAAKHAKLAQTFEGLEETLRDLEVRNAELRMRAQSQLLRLESQGRPADDLDKELNKTKREVNEVQRKNAVQGKQLKKQRAVLISQTQETNNLKAELEKVRKACVMLQRENLELADNPLVVGMKKQLMNMERGYGDIVVQVRETQKSQEGMIDRLKPRLQELHDAAQILWTETSAIASQREEAARLIAIGNARISEFEQLLKDLGEVRDQSAFVLMEHDVDIKAESANQEKRVKEAKQLRKDYCQLINEFRCQNHGLHERKKKAEKDVKTLREEQERLLESLMGYLLVFQESERITSVPAKEILAPLCFKASELRSQMPQEDIWQDEDDDEEEGEVPLCRRPYPSPDGGMMDTWMPKDEPVESMNSEPVSSSDPLYQNMPPMLAQKPMLAAHFSSLAL
eukprot:gnl/MRDRNA2_/MRDRNA2_88010_c0_seq1.p1 gnl/MRDRNA2_/MRDRNA2_88010_c0~~gnl/MRDRNA2_/MRDRNA2_88010_c0_seq1.p1  ORF type:complete len:405 (-),score=118.51 gnl/MRDRNA2_/MRDRNA2_88010_c0_seq1:15-1229(-)